MDMSADRSTMASGSNANGAPLVEQAKQQAGQVVQQTKQAASRVADQAVQQVKTQVETGKERASGSLEDVAQALYSTSETLRERNQEAIGTVAQTGAELVDQVSDYFRERSVDQIAQDVEGFARRQAGLFLGAAFAVGFMLSRFMKSSSPNGSVARPYGDVQAGGYGRATGSLVPASESYGSEITSAGSSTYPSATPTVAPLGESSPAASAPPSGGVR
jgi:uncharacterized protein YjbJ (UPF0337 family)